MTGKELNGNLTNITITLTKENLSSPCAYLDWESSAGDIINTIIFDSKKKENYIAIIKKTWNNLPYIKIVGNTLYIPPMIYWECYKKMPSGKDFFNKNTNSLKINGASLNYPTPQFYFSADAPSNLPGVYGIYYQNKLLYIGSTINLTERWRQHDQCFRNKETFINQMYGLIEDADAIEYKILEDKDSISTLISAETPSMWIYQLIEAIYIKLLEPPYNKEGRTQPFSFQSRSEDLPIDYWKIIKEGLLGIPNKYFDLKNDRLSCLE